MGGCCFQVDIVVACTGTDDDLEIGGSVENLGGYFVGTDDESVDIPYGSDEVCLLRVFLESGEFVAGCFNDFPDAGHCCGREWLLCCYKYFHGLLFLEILEFLHAVHQRLYILDGAGIVDGCPEASDRAVSLDTYDVPGL